MMTNFAQSLKVKAAAELELRRRRRDRQARLSVLPIPEFLARTKIEVPVSEMDTARVPFALWPAQRDVLASLERERLIIFLKARQLGISWLACGFVLRQCVTQSGQPWLLLSRGQLESNELTRRISLLYTEHQDRDDLPRLVKDNMQELVWENGSRAMSLPATKNAGRGFTAAGIILDEWAFMLWQREILAAVKPVIDAGGKLIIISTADGQNTPYHSFWSAAKQGASGYKAIFLPWTAHPDRGPGWRDQKLIESQGDTAGVLREYPENDIEAFTNAAGVVYGEVWRDGPDDGNVTEAADYIPDAGPIYWAMDDGYSAGSKPNSAGMDPTTGTYVADSHPRVMLLVQMRPNGQLCVFAESYACLRLSDDHIKDVLDLGYPAPDMAVHGPGSAEIRGRLIAASIDPYQCTAQLVDSIPVLRSALAADSNGVRRILVHPRCKHLRQEMASYRYDQGTGKPIKSFDHGVDALRGMVWVLRDWV